MKTSKSEKIGSKMNRVREILIRDEEARKNDGLLIGEYWKEELPLLFVVGTAEGVLRAMRTRKLSSPEEITRARRRVQEAYPHLRDTKADEERRTAEAEVRGNIRYTLPDIPSRTEGSGEPSLFDQEGEI
jgi:hypothetical protein